MFIEKSNNAAIVIKQCIIMILSKILQVRIIEFQLIISICWTSVFKFKDVLDMYSFFEMRCDPRWFHRTNTLGAQSAMLMDTLKEKRLSKAPLGYTGW